MMNNTGWNLGFSTLWAVHILSVIVFFTGLLFLIVLAIRTFDDAKLKTWAVWLLIVGAIACLITIGLKGGPWIGFGTHSSWKTGGMMNGSMMERMMDEMMEHDEGAQGEEHDEHEEMEDMMRMMKMRMGMGNDAESAHDASMTMGDMVDALEGKTGDAFDAAFLEGMIPHHEGAIDMANEALENAKHEEIRSMARDIISAQQREIDQMKQWQEAWGYRQ